jgi:short-subunit dehydrogenase
MHVVITGGSQGIGKAIAERFAREGADLFLIARHMDREQGWQQDLMKRFGIRISSYNADLSVREQVAEAARAILSSWDSIDVLVNNAGSFVMGNVHDEPDGNLEKMIELNLYSAYRMSRALLPVMMQRKTGHVFNICSIAALKAYPGGGSYSISKYALDGFSKNLREEMKPHGIRVTSVHPGAVYTRSWEGFVERERIMEANDVAEMIVAATRLSDRACVEDIILRPQAGDL